jgi:hypothetical protein
VGREDRIIDRLATDPTERRLTIWTLKEVREEQQRRGIESLIDLHMVTSVRFRDEDPTTWTRLADE